jgi:hypothetical protein
VFPYEGQFDLAENHCQQLLSLQNCMRERRAKTDLLCKSFGRSYELRNQGNYDEALILLLKT